MISADFPENCFRCSILHRVIQRWRAEYNTCSRRGRNAVGPSKRANLIRNNNRWA
jgi:hypothetical protein